MSDTTIVMPEIKITTNHSVKTNPKATGYSAWAKAGLVFGTSVGTFALAKVTGALSWATGLFSNSNTGMHDGAVVAQVEQGNAVAVEYGGAVVDMHGIQVENNDGVGAVAFKELQVPEVVSAKAMVTKGVRARRSQDNPEVGEEFIIATEVYEQPALTILNNKNFIITYTSNNKVYAQKYYLNGTKFNSAFRLNSASNVANRPTIARLSNDTVVSSWTSLDTVDNSGIYGKIYNIDGITYKGDFKINTYVTNAQDNSQIAAIKDDKFVITWDSDQQDGSYTGIYAQMYYSNGTTCGSEFRVNTYTDNGECKPTITSLVDGKFVIIWNGSGTRDGIYGQMYNNNGIVYGTEFQINTHSNFIFKATTTGLNNGGFVVAWSYNYGGFGEVSGQIYNTYGVKSGNVLTISASSYKHSKYEPFVSEINGDKLLITWTDIYDNGNANSFLKGIILNLDGSYYGNEFIIASKLYSGNNFNSVHANLDNSKIIITYKYDDNLCSIIYSINPAIKTNNLNINEGQSVTITTANLNTIDGFGKNNVDLTFIISNLQHGTFYVNSVNTTSFTLQNIIDGKVTFTHDGGEIAPSYMVSVNDTLGASADPTLASITFTNVNDAPILVTNSLTVNKGKKTILTSSNLSATDVDSDNMALTFNVNAIQYGHFEVNGTTATSFTQQNILDGKVTFTHDGGSVAASYMVSVSDGLASTAAVPANITFVSIDVAPNLTGANSSLGYTEGDGAIIVDNTITLTDVDSPNMSGAVITIRSGYVSGEDYLRFTNQNGITGNFNQAIGVLTLSGTATIDQYQTALRSIQYENTSENPSTLPRVIGWLVSDEYTLNSNEFARQIMVTGINNAPVLAGTNSTLGYMEGNGVIAIDNTITLSDVDSANMNGAVITIKSGYTLGEDYLRFTNQSGIIGSFDQMAGVLTLSGIAPVAQYQVALRGVQYENTSENPSIIQRSIGFLANDGVLNSNEFVRQMTVTKVNNAPELLSTSDFLIYNKETGLVTIDNTILILDADNTTLSGATITIKTNYASNEDYLRFTDQNGISGDFNTVSGVLTLTGNATIVQYQMALRSVKYVNTAANPTTLQRTIEFIVTDGLLNSKGLLKSMVLSSDTTTNPVKSNVAAIAGIAGGAAGGALLLAGAGAFIMHKRRKKEDIKLDELKKAKAIVDHWYSGTTSTTEHKIS